MKKVLFLILVAGITFGYAADKPAVSEQDIKMMEEMGIFDEMEKGGGKEQPRPQMKQMEQRPGGDSRENMEAMILTKVKSELELTPEQAGKFVENFYKAEEVKKEYAKKKMDALFEVRKALDAEKIDEGALNSLVEACNRLDREQMEKMKEAKDKNMAMLTVKQKAKLVIMEGKMQGAFNPNMRKMNKEDPRGDRKEKKEEKREERK